MLNLALAVLTAFTFSNKATDLPKDCLGRYQGEIPAYNVVKDDMEVTVDKQDVSITITDEFVVYRSGNLELKGNYTLKETEDKSFLLTAEMSNGKSINYVLELLVDKKGSKVKVHGKNGEPDVELTKVDKQL